MTTPQFSNDSGALMLHLLEGFIWFDQQLQDYLDQHNMPTVNRTESMVMLLVGAGGIARPTDLAKKLGLARQTINSAIRNLESKRLVRMAEDPQDKRCKIVEPAIAGLEVHLTAMQGLALAEAGLAERIGDARLADLKDTLSDCWTEPHS